MKLSNRCGIGATPSIILNSIHFKYDPIKKRKLIEL